MTNCIRGSFVFPGCKGRRIEASFEVGDITSDGGVWLLRQVDRVLKLSESINKALDDPRRRASCQQDGLSLVRQRLYAMALGYDQVYCARGEMENRIKEQQLDLFADRTSGHRWWPNQFRLLMSSFAYVLLETIRRLGLADTELSRAYVGTIRLKLLKIGAVILRNTRRIRFLLASAHPCQMLYFLVAHRLAPG